MLKIANRTNSKMKNGKIDAISIFMIIVLAIGAGLLIFSLISSFGAEAQGNQAHPQMKKASGMLLTPFDREIGRKLMDQNNDGRCDVCGMPVEQCLDAGQIECNMGRDASSKIGILGSQHAHANFKVYIDEKILDFADNKYYMRSSFLHLDDNLNKEEASSVLHMHATGVPLWIFFKSIGMDFNNDCITLENKQKFCNNGDKKLKFFVNGRENNEFGNYAFKDSDKILISYGNENQEQIQNQLNSIIKR